MSLRHICLHTVGQAWVLLAVGVSVMWSTGVEHHTVRLLGLVSTLSVYYEANICVKVSNFSLPDKCLDLE